MNAIQHDLSNALQVMTRDLKIRAWLEANNPKALTQACDALEAEYNAWTEENSEYYAQERKISDAAFANALKIGRFVAKPPGKFSEANYVGHFMYMHSSDTHDFFKHIDTREYVEVKKG